MFNLTVVQLCLINIILTINQWFSLFFINKENYCILLRKCLIKFMDKKVLLLILDGWGVGDQNDHNAIHLAQPEYWQKLLKNNPHTVLDAKEEVVGLPAGCMSGSEVGHLTIGAGRIIWQGAARIEQAIKDGSWWNNHSLKQTLVHLKNTNGKLHLIGLLSDGGIHSHYSHLLTLIDWAEKNNVNNICLHLFLDGRDMAQKSALDLLKREILPKLNSRTTIATICGRAIAMDRGENWDRTTTTYKLLTTNSEVSKLSIERIIEENYDIGITDEFIQPTRLNEQVISSGDGVIFFNFRADRMRQLVDLFLGKAPGAEQDDVKPLTGLCLVSMTEYDPQYEAVQVMFPPEYPKNTLGEWVSLKNKKQFRIAETEKYAHVTYFFNGGREDEFDGETRLVIPSLGLTNYASRPEMSLPEVSKTLLRVLEMNLYDLVVCNIANGDMVGHSGDLAAGILAVKEIDKALAEIVPIAVKNNYVVMITADHGNIEKMKEKDEPHTAHTFNDVPFVVVGEEVVLPEKGYLHQIAPSILKILKIDPPAEITSQSLF